MRNIILVLRAGSAPAYCRSITYWCVTIRGNVSDRRARCVVNSVCVWFVVDVKTVLRTRLSSPRRFVDGIVWISWFAVEVISVWFVGALFTLCLRARGGIVFVHSWRAIVVRLFRYWFFDAWFFVFLFRRFYSAFLGHFVQKVYCLQ